jgi:hypothetical protein
MSCPTRTRVCMVYTVGFGICNRDDLGLEVQGGNSYFPWQGCSSAPRGSPPPGRPLRLDLVRYEPAPLHSSQCAARRRPGCLVPSTRSTARWCRSRRSPTPWTLDLPTARVPVRRSLLVAAQEPSSRDSASAHKSP